MTLLRLLTDEPNPTGDDLLYLLDDPATSRGNRKLTLTNLAGSVAFSSLYATGAGLVAEAAARAAADAALDTRLDTAEATLAGLGTMATQNANAVAITGGTVAGITDLAVADGGTGASDAATARTNLGLLSMAIQAASAVAITGGTVTGITDLAVADGGTGASTAAGARTNLGAVGLTGDETIAGIKTFSSDPLIPDEAYDEAAWNGKLEPPTKNALRDKIESIPVVGTTADVVPDTVTTPGTILWNLGDNPTTNALDLQSHVKITSARLATHVALPACTYSNGSSGVGATLTGDAVGALADIDFRTPVANDIILVKNQATAAQNGIYKVTTLGSGGAAFVLTRIAEADIAADFVDGVTCLISDGEFYKGATFHAAGTITMGTTSIVWYGDLNTTGGPAPLKMGMARDRRFYDLDYEEFTTTITTTGTLIPGTPSQISLIGTAAQATDQSGDSGGSFGVVALETGTLSSGAIAIAGSRAAATISSSTRALCAGRFRTPTLATATEDFNCWLGFWAAAVGNDPTDCIAIKAPAFGAGPLGNYLAVTRSGGVETVTDTGVAQSTTYRVFRIVVDEVAGNVRFYLQVSGVMTLVAPPHTTNIPNASMFFGGLIDKTAGTTSRNLRIDRLVADLPETRTSINML